MNVSEIFIRKPIGTSLLMAGILVFGVASYQLLPVAALPTVDFPTITVSATLPGASPDTMASSVATPLEQQFATIPGLAQMTSTSGLGTTSITLQFDLNRNIDGAAGDVQTAINAASGLLPKDLPNPPTYRKTNPADRAILIYAVYSDALPLYRVDDYAYTIMAQRISQIAGVSQVDIAGQQQYAVHVQINPTALASRGIGFEDVRNALSAATLEQAKGNLEGQSQTVTLDTNDQLFNAAAFSNVIVAYRNGAPVRVKDVGHTVNSSTYARTGAWYNGRPAELLLVRRQAGANTLDVVNQVKAQIPLLQAAFPPSIHIDLVSDRSQNIRESVNDVQLTLALTIGLVVMVIFLFLRNFWATVIPSVVVPLSLVATFGVMYALGYSLDNLSLMGLTIAVGFVVDDAIVMIENIVRYLEQGERPLDAAIKGASQIGFTIISITISLVAVFIPLLFMAGIVGRLFREFAMTVTTAVLVSGFISLTLTPVMCSLFLTRESDRPKGRLNRAAEAFFAAMIRRYDQGLQFVFRHQLLTLMSTLALIVVTGVLYVYIPKGFFPEQDTGFIFGQAEARQDTSFAAIAKLENEFSKVILTDPAVAGSCGICGGHRRQRDGEHRPAVHPAQAARRAQNLSARGDPAPAPQSVGGDRRELLHAGGARRHGRRAPVQDRIPIYADQLRHGRAQSLGADPAGADGEASRTAGRCLGSANRLSARGDRNRSQCRISPRPYLGASRPDALRRVRPAPGGDDLHIKPSVQGDSGSGAAIPERPGCARGHLYLDPDRSARSAEHDCQVQHQGRAAHRQSSGPVSVGHAVVQRCTWLFARPGGWSHSGN